MLITRNEGVLIQGVTGRQGRFWTSHMRSVGTRVLAGTSPGKGGQDVDGVPVYDNAQEAARHHDLDVSVLFVPPLGAKAAALEALDAGVRKVVMLTEHVPVQDVMEVLAAARALDAQVLGPNTAGLVVPGQAAAGIMPCFAEDIFLPGRVGVVSRSGSLGTLVCLDIVRHGFGESAFIGIGGDPILGTTTTDAVRTLDRDERTDVVIVVGEIGGAMEEEAADYISGMKKPVVALIAGRSAPPGRRMGHAGAIVSGNTGSGEGKVAALRRAGATVVDLPTEIGAALRNLGLTPTSVQPGSR
ncbi:MAG: succinate--CoA ligase subunit alpha [Mycobacteriales bacterium]